MTEIPACAAIYNPDLEMIVAEKRHDRCYKGLINSGVSHIGFIQGFMTNQGRFVDRTEAMILAKAANMHSCYRKDGKLRGDELFSEDLY
jgi:hypothetical protein